MLSQVRPEQAGRRPEEVGVYSLFPNAPAPEMTARGAAYSLFPSAGMQHVSSVSLKKVMETYRKVIVVAFLVPCLTVSIYQKMICMWT